MSLEIAELFNGAHTERELSHALEVAADKVGASTFAASRFASADHGPSVNAVCRFPAGYADTFEGTEFPCSTDPVMQHLRTSSVPIVWNSETYNNTGNSRAFEPMGDFGVRSGIALTLHLGFGRHFCLGFNWREDHIPDDPGMGAFLQICAVFAEPAFFRVWNKLDMTQLDISVLTERELECLYWAGKGLSVPMIGAQLGIGRSVEKRLRSAHRKLGASNSVEAAVLATRLGLLESFHLEYGREYFKPTIFAIE